MLFKHIRNALSHNYSAKFMEQVVDAMEELERQVQEIQSKVGLEVAGAADQVSKQAAKLKDAAVGGKKAAGGNKAGGGN